MTIRFFSHSYFRKGFLIVFALLLLLLTGCASKLDYTAYISELRSNILLAEADGFSLRIYAVEKEIPYIPDGIPREKTTRLEAYLHTPEGNQNCQLFFRFDDREFHGEMSYDNVKAEYFFSCTLDVSKANNLPCKIQYGEKEIEMTAQSVRSANILSAENVLSVLEASEAELFASLTDKYGFAGEIYIRLICEDAPYYYVGIIDRNGVVNAFLINAQSGKILAKRTT